MITRTTCVILALLGIVVWAGTEVRVHTTAKLPKDSLIWPLDETNTPVMVECSFASETNLMSVREGDFETLEKLVIYDVTRVIKGDYPYKQLIFVCKYHWPTKESGIMMKALVWPFRKGTKIFYLTEDIDCRTEKYFKITSYSR